ncbi:bifunctional tRNA (5-methylaminomethyl-2-thiouridine)(34)-methyltransferase MnmD/FAD-dependent 5-carboxymethylaminomethyl-2-thiouridine(34) oxidoreductase MnmC [Exilibacterium tricleocarpae]|uniref:tRNA 5-methylaminomethyl-2-thiouridine biosynthesis bifunctional protein MnmC n=1 Tax=Exilibacterium tricleocarpae TaxID=2591008 RepID=A0A545SS25_9GAMM|nr:bifunctional tRNA (5-methylaminomethyl-2-thiouridine)(34)-methyltransferase MnmD/FAD-dependent 5-carboxymethylaminomethyl-2-thiouridine(34) oxidoreductase MnmC [Exilibacterium tricleocarpae]TQV67771.1 bifunctional tRNA (5-methylaminomethyl-2-thiouridine)(34)-methyltransferase MnmD/FAD-dependent 5-carboxymethylaminomethyl-2-thiouridine(34) oxidoreductase MnmC [Exilibacterium tricleocarpae]
MSDPSARITWDAAGQPVSADFDDVYFSRADGLAETRHVFLHHNHLARRWRDLPAEKNGSFTIAETGFGTGLNFLAAWMLWQQAAPPSWQLHFISVEKFPLADVDLSRALHLWPSLQPLAEQLLAAYPPAPTRGFHRRHFGPVTLTLIIDDAAAGLAELLAADHRAVEQPAAPVDAWLLDGFAPAKNPQMWSPALFDLIGRLSAPGTTAATFTAAGVVKRGLQDAGFDIEKVAGFGRKRDMLRARFRARALPIPEQPAAAGKAPPGMAWPVVHSRDRVAAAARSALVIGGGLAGCHSARALARRGWQVTLLEQYPHLAGGASGNPQGVLYAKLSHTRETFSEFNLSALLYAQAFYQPLWQNHGDLGRQCGVLQLAYSETVEHQHRALAHRFGEYRRFLRRLPAEAASTLAGTLLNCPGLYFPAAGWLKPAAVCRQLAAHPKITVLTDCRVESLQRSGEHWVALDRGGHEKARAAVAVIASAHHGRQFDQTRYLPLRAIRGQVSYLPATAGTETLATVLCGKGYIAPAAGGQHCLGATFDLREATADLRPADHRRNLDNFAAVAPALHAAGMAREPHTLAGRVGFRCATPDYLPVVGPVPRLADFLDLYAPLRRNARADIAAPGRYWPGLYVNLGHGSRGLCYTPISAELLAGLITAQPAPLPRPVRQALHPARFIIRDLIRNKI